MPDALHWLGVTKIHRFISMSDMKYDAIVNSGITIVERVEIPAELIPADAQVEIAAKVFIGYHGGDTYKFDKVDLEETKGRSYDGAAAAAAAASTSSDADAPIAAKKWNRCRSVVG